MGAAGIVERYSQITPKILFIDTQVRYAEKQIDLSTKMADAVKNLRTKTDLRQTVVIQGPKLEILGVISRSIIHSTSCIHLGLPGPQNVSATPLAGPF